MHRLTVTGSSARERGVCRGRQVASVVHEHWPIHLELFRAVGRDDAGIEQAAMASFDALTEWWPEGAEEVRGVAEGADLPLWRAAALNARTELLISEAAVHAGRECTIVATTDPVAAAQTWDWHRELNQAWHAQRVEGTPVGFTGITEHGICAKIGRNDAGIGLLLAILSHRDDSAGGVPIHLVAHRVLSECRTLREAIDVARGAPVSSSSVFQLTAPDSVAAIELSPSGNETLAPQGRWYLHTNHFLAPSLAEGSRTFRNDPDSQERMTMLVERAAPEPRISGGADLVPMLTSRPGEDIGNICCYPRPDQPLGKAWQTLATVWMDRAGLVISEGTPWDVDAADRVTS